jgi:ribosomal protein S18 acetylase RimI-like enzyme
MNRLSNLPIQRLDKSKDLQGMADLIELCFSQDMDPDGKKYINFLRESALKNFPAFNTFNGNGFRLAAIDGFICKSNNQVIGNLSMSPFLSKKGRLLFISNIAVHPDFRNIGIGNRLIRRIVDFAKENDNSSIWLQVRKENEIAFQLYSSLDFQTHSIRDTWLIEPGLKHFDYLSEGLILEKRRTLDWKSQKDWLEEIYPEEIQWLLEMNMMDFGSSIWHKIFNMISGRNSVHWSIIRKKQLMGVISWQPTYRYADQIWIAASRDSIKTVVGCLPIVQEMLNVKKDLMVNLPEKAGSPILHELGIKKIHTLIWMNKDLDK